MKKLFPCLFLLLCSLSLLCTSGCTGGTKAPGQPGRGSAGAGKIKVTGVSINGVTVGMTESEVQAKLGKGNVMQGMDSVIDYQDITVFLNKERRVQSVNGTASDMNTLPFTVEVNGKKLESNLDSYKLGVALEATGKRANSTNINKSQFYYELDGGSVRADYGPAAAISIMVSSNP